MSRSFDFRYFEYGDGKDFVYKWFEKDNEPEDKKSRCLYDAGDVPGCVSVSPRCWERVGAHADRPIFSDPRVKHTRDYRRPKYNEGRDAAWNSVMREEERRNRYNVRRYESDSGEDLAENSYVPFAGRIDSHWEKAASYHNLWMRLVSVKVELENERKYIRMRMEEVKNR